MNSLSQATPATAAKEYFQDAITVLVGPTEDSFAVHKAPVCEVSPFFRAALDGNFRESKEGIIKLPDEDPKIFGCFLHWLYNKRLRTPTDGIDVLDKTNKKVIPWMVLIQLYLLGERLQVAGFKNAAVDALALKSAKGQEALPAAHAIHHAYENTHDSSPLRRLLVDLFIWRSTAATLEHDETRDALPRDFFVDLATSAMRLIEDGLTGPNTASEVLFASDYYENQTVAEAANAQASVPAGSKQHGKKTWRWVFRLKKKAAKPIIVGEGFGDNAVDDIAPGLGETEAKAAESVPLPVPSPAEPLGDRGGYTGTAMFPMDP
ncbi:MAG: hypothetical protein M1829_002895 [Trizodia sp. TS-e1964]|nr:MAG: hypothetical protein M1829_002895 [Trizodia sp. TS-e1964]